MYKYIVVDVAFNDITETIRADSAAEALRIMASRGFNDKYYALYVKVGG